MDLREWLSEVGELTSDGNLTRGVMIVGAAVLTVVLTCWRAFRGKPKDVERVRIDAPANVEITVRPRAEKAQPVQVFLPSLSSTLTVSSALTGYGATATTQTAQPNLSPATRRLAEEGCGSRDPYNGEANACGAR